MDRRRSPLENALQPLVSGLVEVSPSLWKHTKRIGKYWLMLPFDCSKILFDIATGRYEYVTDEMTDAVFEKVMKALKYSIIMSPIIEVVASFGVGFAMFYAYQKHI